MYPSLLELTHRLLCNFLIESPKGSVSPYGTPSGPSWPEIDLGGPSILASSLTQIEDSLCNQCLSVSLNRVQALLRDRSGMAQLLHCHNPGEWAPSKNGGE